MQLNRVLLSRKEASAALSISVRTLDEMIATKRIRTVRIGRRVLIPLDEINRLARSRDSAA